MTVEFRRRQSPHHDLPVDSEAPGSRRQMKRVVSHPTPGWMSTSSPTKQETVERHKARICLTDVGDGVSFQIRDIEFLSTRSNHLL